MKHFFILLTPVIFLLALGRTTIAQNLLTFDDVATLSEYSTQGVSFSANASIWTSNTASVLNNPDGGAVTVPNGLQFGNAGGVLGSIFFDQEVTDVSIYALSGPSPDLLSSMMWIRAFDEFGNQLDEVNVDSALQFDLLTTNATGIRRLDLFSNVVGNDVWDNLAFTVMTQSNFELGDVNRNGMIDFLDIAPFITLLSSGDYQFEGDVDQNGFVDFLDIAPFIALLSGN